MNKKTKEPFFAARTANMVLGFIILLLILLVIYKDSHTEFFQIMIFALAAVMNFIAATVNFSEQKKLRGNIYAVICALFLIVAIVMILGFIGII
jgi:uncharacterized membrane protein HdeD (DUF308 family)